MSRSLRDKVIVITGASSGIGAATALACAEAGMCVVISARREDRLKQVAQQVEQRGGRSLVVCADVRDDQQVHALIDRTMDRFGRLDALFANAGYGLFARVVDTTESQMRDLFETNFWGTVRCIQAAMPAMRQTLGRGGNGDGDGAAGGLGHVLICTSAVSEIGPPMYGFYAATKAAQDAVACAMRAEMMREGVYVSTVHPIGTKTEFFEVVKRESNVDGAIHFNTPASLQHTAQKVAACVVRCLRRPRAEVWPSAGARLGLALTTAMPSLGAWSMRHMVMSRYRDGHVDGDGHAENDGDGDRQQTARQRKDTD